MVRNVYPYILDRRRVGELVDGFPATSSMLRTELTDFAELLDQISPGGDTAARSDRTVSAPCGTIEALWSVRAAVTRLQVAGELFSVVPS